MLRFLQIRCGVFGLGVAGLALGGNILAQELPAKPPIVEIKPEQLKPLPISLDAVFHLAEEQNGQISLARERLTEAYANKDLASSSWLPSINVGPAYYRHEGGIQNEDGTLTHSSTGALFGGMEFYSRVDLRESVYTRVNAQRQIWQNKGELTRVTNETLLEAANTYIDLLTARTAETIARDLEKSQQDLGKDADELAKDETSLRYLVEVLRSAQAGQKQKTVEVHRQGDAASAKLVYLLGLGPCTELQPLDGKLLPLDLVDATPACDDLVCQALANGPGIREMEGLLTTIQDGLEKAKGPGKYMPILEMRVLEGVFGAGPGDDMRWDNRLDLGLQARWNLTDFATAQEKLRIAHSKLRQAHLTYQDLRAKLSAGVQEARESSQSGKEQIRLAADQIKHATEAYNLTKTRLKEHVKGSSPAEVLGTLQAVAQAQISYLTAINAYDKAQLRLMMLLGPAACIPPTLPEGTPVSKAVPLMPVVLPATQAVSPKPEGLPSDSARSGLDALKDAQSHFRRR